MLNSLRNSISRTIQSITEKLSSPFKREEETEEAYRKRSNLKRNRMSQISLDEASRPDILVTPPEKRLKFHKEQRKLIDDNATNAFFWKYVVEGKTNPNEGEEKSLERIVVDRKKGIDDAKVEADILASSPFPFKKVKEPRLQVHRNPVDMITKRKPLTSQLPHTSQTAVSKQRFLSREEKGSLPNIKTNDSDKEAVVERCIFEDPEIKKPTLSTWTSARRAKTADAVVRLEERERYRKLLAQYTSTPYLDNTDVESSKDGNCEVSKELPSVSMNDICGTFGLKSGKKSISSVLEQQMFSRLERADSILERFSSVIGERPSSSALLSSATVSSDAKLLKEALSSIDHNISAEVPPERKSKDQQRVFSGTDTRNISRNERKVDSAGIDPLGNSWTLRWRKALQEDELDRQKEIKKEEMKLKSCENKRKEREAELWKKIEARKNLGKKAEVPKHVPLTEDMRRMISNAWRPGNPQECLVQAFNVTITRHDLTSLANMNWLNDEVVNFYFHLLQERSSSKGNLKMHFFNSFFYPKLLKTGYSGVRRWTKKVDIFSVDIVVLPVHLGMHWCLAAIDMRKKHIAYYDSLKGNNNQCLVALRNYIIEEHKDKKKTSLNIDEWSQILPKNIPEQKNGCDCGVFTCKYAECLTRDSPFIFTQNDMPYFRERMVYEILTKKLL